MPDKTKLYDINDLSTITAWLLELLAFWQERIIDPEGGFYEELDANSHPVISQQRHSFVAARLVSTYCKAALKTGRSDFKETACHGLQYLTVNCRSPEGGYYKSLNRETKHPDFIQDSYTQAFILLAAASYYRLTFDQQAIAIADNCWSFIESFLADKVYGGIHERYDFSDSPILLPRTQNASMHLLEATLAMYKATHNNKWLDRSADLVKFSREHFIDRSMGGIIEFFDESWKEWKQPLINSSAPDKSTASRQTGHVLERAKLMLEYYQLLEEPGLMVEVELLAAFAKKGIEQTGKFQGLVCDQLSVKGDKVPGSMSLWQSLEYLAFLGLKRTIASSDLSTEIKRTLEAIGKYFIHPDNLTWHNRLDKNGVPADSTSASRLIYHLYPAFEALLDDSPAM